MDCFITEVSLCSSLEEPGVSSVCCATATLSFCLTSCSPGPDCLFHSLLFVLLSVSPSGRRVFSQVVVVSQNTAAVLIKSRKGGTPAQLRIDRHSGNEP